MQIMVWRRIWKVHRKTSPLSNNDLIVFTIPQSLRDSGRKCNWLPTLAKNMPPAYFLNASCPLHKGAFENGSTKPSLYKGGWQPKVDGRIVIYSNGTKVPTPHPSAKLTPSPQGEGFRQASYKNIFLSRQYYFTQRWLT